MTLRLWFVFLFRLDLQFQFQVLYLGKWINIPVSYLTCWSYFCTSVVITRKTFSLTQIRRNLYIGRSPAAGLLPQAEAPRSPWQPRHSDGQHRVGAGRAAALSHRPPALMGNHCPSSPPPNVVPVVQSSFTFSGVFVCLSKKKGVFSAVLWLHLFHCTSSSSRVWEHHASQRASGASLTPSLKCLDVCACMSEWVCNNHWCISLIVCAYGCPLINKPRCMQKQW